MLEALPTKTYLQYLHSTLCWCDMSFSSMTLT